MPKINNNTAYPLVTTPAGADLVVCLQSDVVKKMTVDQINSVAGAAPVTVTYTTTATTTLTVADMNLILAVEVAGATVVNLPSVAAGDIGTWVIIHKMGAGNLVINAADSDKINDSSAGGAITNDTAAQTYAVISLVLITATEWRQQNMPLGSWTTS